MKEIKIWKMALIWFGTIFFVAIGEIIYSLPNDNLEVNEIITAFIVMLSILIVTLISGRVGTTVVKERCHNFKKIASIKEILTVVLTQLLLSTGIANLSIGVLASNNPNKALELLNDSLGNPNNRIELILWLITIVILAPILEEIVFRRVLFKRLNMKFSFISSSIISSLIFGFGHESLSILGAVVFGVACCVLYKKYNNLLVPISVHVINNLSVGILSTISYFNGTLNETTTTITSLDIKIYLISGILLTLITLIIFIRFIIKNKQYLRKKEKVLQNL
ncbi:CPBP family intramembrane glutamic endopeptidase (plasmid) [Paraclostridium ghonii]|uniref:CPBP family intramembrane glutamic endopeptidase n=1 Tax=Paraclostridium ghonii TaxID=29358 RepID=UPI00202CBCF6|nr:CPBP family intramembrane glutamic endopeptidase [Paeniclostridium ghonii]MCM0167921.1 CPBP family intramembrane metalloprotease [Paeniclostridium ghonii]